MKFDPQVHHHHHHSASPSSIRRALLWLQRSGGFLRVFLPFPFFFILATGLFFSSIILLLFSVILFSTYAMAFMLFLLGSSFAWLYLIQLAMPVRYLLILLLLRTDMLQQMLGGPLYFYAPGITRDPVLPLMCWFLWASTRSST